MITDGRSDGDRWCDDRSEVVDLYDALRAHGFGNRLVRRGDGSVIDVLVRALFVAPWNFAAERAHVRAEQHLPRDCWICLDDDAVDDCDCAGCIAVKNEQIEMSDRCATCRKRMAAGECQTPRCPEFVNQADQQGAIR